MQTIDRAVMADGTKIQLEDWHSENSEEYPDLHGYTISAYPIAKNTSRFGWIIKGEKFRLAIARNEYANYTDDMVLADYEALKNGANPVTDWDGNEDNPQAVYDNIVSFEYGWEIVADNDGMYPDKMGCAACFEFGIKKE